MLEGYIVQFSHDNPEIRDLVSEYVKFIRVLLTIQLHQFIVFLNERSFSYLKHINSYLWSTMKQKHLTQSKMIMKSNIELTSIRRRFDAFDVESTSIRLSYLTEESYCDIVHLSRNVVNKLNMEELINNFIKKIKIRVATFTI